VKRFCCIAWLAVLLGGTSGCAAVAIGVPIAAGTADTKVSQWTDGECSVENILVWDGFCHKAEVKPPPQLYCFRSIGDVDCYAEADPYQVSSSGRSVPPASLATPDLAADAAKPETKVDH
jgi:hypothetical protein